MKDKRKQIEEMSIANKDLMELCKLLFENWDGTVINVAKLVLEHYQPKLPEDSVVLSREEFEKLKDQANIKCDVEIIREAVFDATSCVIGYEVAEKIYQRCFPNNPERFVKERKPSYNDGYFDGSKETAEKILIKGKQLVEKWLSKDDEKVGFIFDFEEFIKKQFGVEIKES